MVIFAAAFVAGLALLGGSEALGTRLLRAAVLDGLERSSHLRALTRIPHLVRFVGPMPALPYRRPSTVEIPEVLGTHVTELPRRLVRVLAHRGHTGCRLLELAAALACRTRAWSSALLRRVESYVLGTDVLSDWADLALPRWDAGAGRHRPWSPMASTVHRPYAWSWATEPTGEYASPYPDLSGEAPVTHLDRCWLDPASGPMAVAWMKLGAPVTMRTLPLRLSALAAEVRALTQEPTMEEPTDEKDADVRPTPGSVFGPRLGPALADAT